MEKKNGKLKLNKDKIELQHIHCIISSDSLKTEYTITRFKRFQPRHKEMSHLLS